MRLTVMNRYKTFVSDMSANGIKTKKGAAVAALKG